MDKQEAIKILKEFHDTSALFSVRTALETVFPELKEDEDEKIRKALIEYFNAYPKDYFGGLKKNYIVAWLEKQVEQKPIIEIKSPEESLGISSKEYNDAVNECLYGESKPADNIEAKFHKGEWIISKYMHLIMQILNNDNGSYETVETDGTERNDSYGFIERNFKLWTIKDAKDGDVLVASDDKRPFIFKGLLDPNHPNCPVAYCGIDSDGLFFVSTGDHWWTDENVYPATKEQRDILFAKMKLAGYEWDAEKKELKIIDWSKHVKYEPNGPSIIDENTEWSEEDEKNLIEVISIVQNISSYDKQYDGYVNWLKSIRQRIGE